VNMSSTVETILKFTREGKKSYICVTGVHGVMKCQSDEKLKDIHNRSGLTVPDGMPLVWIGKICGLSDVGRVYGPDPMLELFRRSIPEGFRHFLYGGNIGVAEELKTKLYNMFPWIRIVGTYTPPFRELNRKERQKLKEEVLEIKPDFSANGKVKCPKMAKKMTHFFWSRIYGLDSFKAVESSFSERKITRRDWDVRSSHA